MRRFFIVAFILALTGTAFAQDKTLLGDEIDSGGYGAVVVKYGRILGADGIFVGGQGGWVINHSFVLGGGGYGLANQVPVDESGCPYLGFGYGGLLLEYIISPRELVHGSIQCLIGAGGVSYSEQWQCGDSYSYESDEVSAILNSGSAVTPIHMKATRSSPWSRR